MDNLSDLATNCAVRKVLVRHWIDLGKISVRTSLGVVSLTGELQRISNSTGGLNASALSAIIFETKLIPTVRRVIVNVCNWTSSNDGWQEVAYSQAPQPMDTESVVSR